MAAPAAPQCFYRLGHHWEVFPTSEGPVATLGTFETPPAVSRMTWEAAVSRLLDFGLFGWPWPRCLPSHPAGRGGVEEVIRVAPRCLQNPGIAKGLPPT